MTIGIQINESSGLTGHVGVRVSAGVRGGVDGRMRQVGGQRQRVAVAAGPRLGFDRTVRRCGRARHRRHRRQAARVTRLQQEGAVLWGEATNSRS